ncbi:cytohesin-1 isoform X1 [Tachysurus ichikawai]
MADRMNCFELYSPSHKDQVIKACKAKADGRFVEGNHVVYRISISPYSRGERGVDQVHHVGLITVSNMCQRHFPSLLLDRITTEASVQHKPHLYLVYK